MDKGKLKEKLKTLILEVESSPVFKSEETKEELRQLAGQLSNSIRQHFGECEPWYMANKILRIIDNAPVEH